MGDEERDELSLEEAAALLGLPPAKLVELLREAGMRIEKGSEVRLRAAEVMKLQREREKHRSRYAEELNRLSEEMGDEDEA